MLIIQRLCVEESDRERDSPYSKGGAYGSDFSEAGSGVTRPWGPTYIYYSCFRGSDSHSAYVWLQAGLVPLFWFLF